MLTVQNVELRFGARRLDPVDRGGRLHHAGGQGAGDDEQLQGMGTAASNWKNGFQN